MIESFKSFFNFGNDNNRFSKRQVAAIKLILWFIFIGSVSAFFALNAPRDSGNEVSTGGRKLEDGEAVINAFFSDNQSYTFTYIIDAKYVDHEGSLTYFGSYIDSKTYLEKEIEDEMIKYMYQDKQLYVYDEEQLEYVLTNNEAFGEVDYSYLEVGQILEYLSNSVLEYKKEYSDGSYEFMYNVYLKKIVDGYVDDDYFTLLIKKGDNVEINIDYTNLFKTFKDGISSVLVDLEFSNK